MNPICIPPSNIATRCIYPALSYSRALNPHLAIDQTWQVLSVHRHACNLRNMTGHLLALVSPYHGNGPFHLVAPAGLHSQPAVNDKVHLAQKRLCWGQTIIDLQPAQCWEPVVRWPQNIRSLAMLLQSLHEQDRSSLSWFSDRASASAAFTTRVHQARLALLAGARSNDQRQLGHGAQLLAGLGPGLTPAGDDFLLGWMAGVYLCAAVCQDCAPPQACCEALALVAQERTTRLSAAWLHHAAQGAFGAPWHALAASLYTETPRQIARALQHIARSGASSGHDALAGLGWALTCCGY